MGAVGFVRTLVPLSISAAMGCSGKVLRHRVEAEHPKTGQVSRQKQRGPPPQPWWHQGVFIYTKWSSSIRRSASSALAGAFLAPWSPWGGGAQTPGGPCHHVGASCPCSTLCGGVGVNQARAAPTGHL